MSGKRSGIPNKRSLLASADMDRLGINPIEMLKEIYDTAMEGYRQGRGISEKADSGAAWLSVARSAASDLASFKHPKLSAVALKDVRADSEGPAMPMTTIEALKILNADPIAMAVPSSDVVDQMTSAIETPVLPKGEDENV